MTSLKGQEKSVRNKKCNSMYILFTQPEHDNIDFGFAEEEIKQFIFLWDKGLSIPDISKQLGRKQIEITLLAMDLRYRKKIKNRAGGFFGSEVLV